MNRSLLYTYGEPESWSSYKIVARHPLADQEDVLKKINVNPIDFQSCDCWWETRKQLVLVSIWCDNRIEASFKSQNSDSSFYVRTRSSPLTTGAVNRILSRLEHWIDNNEDVFQNLNTVPIKISTDDIGL